MKTRQIAVILAVWFTGLFAVAQETAPNTSANAVVASAVVPNLIQFPGIAKDLDGNPLTGTVGVSFFLYKEEQGGAPLWMETQNVEADTTGHYTVQLGATKSTGLPTDIFTTGEAHWLGVQISGQGEQPRVLLLSVPYALKAADAETIGGLPPSAFVKATPMQEPGSFATGNTTSSSAVVSSGSSKTGKSVPPSTSTVTTSGGVINDIPLWTTATNIQSSIMSQNTSTSTVGAAGTLEVDDTGINAGTKLPGMQFGASNSGETISSARTAGSANQFGLDFWTNSNRSMSITNGGDVGIATTTPAGPLHINGPAAVPPSGLASGNNGLVLGLQSTAGYKWIQSYGGVLALNPIGNNVGIGTTTPGSTLDVRGAGNFSNGVSGTSNSVGAAAVYGNNTATSGAGTNGGSFYSSSPQGAGVVGVNTSGGAAGYFQGPVTVAGLGNVPSISATNGTVGNSAVYGNNSATSGTGTNGVYGSTSSPAGAGTVGVNFSTGGSGVYGQTNGNTAGSAGVYGYATATSGFPRQVYGTYGIAASQFGIGGFGQNGSLSSTGSGLISNQSAGIWGDGGAGGSNTYFGVTGTVDNGTAGLFANNSSGGFDTLVATARNSASQVFLAEGLGTGGGSCSIDFFGNLNCSGAKHAIVSIDGGTRKVALSAIESPKNWFEDFGSEQLLSGSAVVTIDPEFAQTVNTEKGYMVIPVPNGECKGLYVTNKTPTSFEVRELGGGTSSIRFDYRIVVLRKNYENIRFADHTNDPGPRKQISADQEVQP